MNRQGHVGPATAPQTFTVNGLAATSSARTLLALLIDLGYGNDKVATAHNGTFVPEGARATTELASGDRIEILSPRQGG
jgi:sulfur carrier protein